MEENQNNQNNTNSYNPNPNTYNQGGYNQNQHNQNTYNTGSYNPNPGNPYYAPQQPYYNPYQQNRPYDPYNEPMELKDWIITFLLMLIPFANLVLPFVWAFGSNVNRSKKTFFQASLIWFAIILGIYIILAIFFFSMFASMFNRYSYY